MNKVILSGNLTRDVELKITASGKALARMSIAVSRPFAKDKADFFNLIAWEKQAEFCHRYLKKGSGVIVEGRIENDNYEKDGVKHYGNNIQVERIEFAGRKKDNDAPPDDDGFDGEYEREADIPF